MHMDGTRSNEMWLGYVGKVVDPIRMRTSWLEMEMESHLEKMLMLKVT